MKVIKTISVAERDLLAIQTELSIIASKFEMKSQLEDAILQSRNKLAEAIKLNRQDPQKPQTNYVYVVETETAIVNTSDVKVDFVIDPNPTICNYSEKPAVRFT